ncbi:hypothetical protein J437_LFUL004202 [Ladona fulva]|uniref:Transmembrane and TPR repeat-containing protein 3 n=1 Tax=Ladona fulva TaxID=123851 RepID=A0A8K0NZI7_LADFU|nr:hypothetical protein J437_LFUL004202 [Ladona fulva]
MRRKGQSEGGCGWGKGHREASKLYGAVVAVALGCYINGLGGDFVHDDIPAVVQNKDVLGHTPVTDLLRNDFWGTDMGDAASHKSYRPLTVLTFRSVTSFLVYPSAALLRTCGVLRHGVRTHG